MDVFDRCLRVRTSGTLAVITIELADRTMVELVAQIECSGTLADDDLVRRVVTDPAEIIALRKGEAFAREFAVEQPIEPGNHVIVIILR